MCIMPNAGAHLHGRCGTPAVPSRTAHRYRWVAHMSVLLCAGSDLVEKLK